MAQPAQQRNDPGRAGTVLRRVSDPAAHARALCPRSRAIGGVDVAPGGLVVRQPGQQHAHRAGVGQGGEGQPGADAGRPRTARRAARCRPATDSSTIRPATRRTWRSRLHRSRPRSTGAPAEIHAPMPPVITLASVEPGVGELDAGLGGPVAGLADQHQVAAGVGDDAAQVRVDLVQGQVDGAGDVRGLELRRGADVDDEGVRVVGQPRPGGGHVDGGSAVCLWSSGNSRGRIGGAGAGGTAPAPMGGRVGTGIRRPAGRRPRPRRRRR